MTFPVMLTFDHDAESASLAADPNNVNRPGVLSIGRYAPNVAVGRLLSLLKEEGISSTWFVPGWVIDTYPASVEAIVAAGHELAHHGYTHTPPAQFPDRAAEEAELVRGIECIERVSGARPRGYRSPSWDFSPHTLGLLEQHGFEYSSNLMDNDTAYRHTLDGRATQLVELPIQWMNDDAPFFSFRPPYVRPMQPPSHPFEIWCDELRALHGEPGKLFVLTMHPHLIGRPSGAAMLRRFIAFARALTGVEFTTCAAVAASFRAR
jgi:peptidoglycan/xylan/chitin deacetylase (PgdA/CDA1 family)